MSATINDYNEIKECENKSTGSLILLGLFFSMNICILISRSVMEAVGNNDGKDCPNVGGPATACAFYGISVLLLIGLIIKYREKLSGLKIAAFGLLAAVNLGIFIAYIVFSVKAQKHDSSTDTECLTNANKDAIEKMELIITGILTFILTPIMNFMK